MRMYETLLWWGIAVPSFFASVSSCTYAEDPPLPAQAQADPVDASAPAESAILPTPQPNSGAEAVAARLSEMAVQVYSLQTALEPAAFESRFKTLHPDADPNDLRRFRMRLDTARRLLTWIDRDLDAAAELLDVRDLAPRELKMQAAVQRLDLARRHIDLAKLRRQLAREEDNDVTIDVAELDLDLAHLREDMAWQQGELDWCRQDPAGESTERVQLATAKLQQMAADLLKIRQQEFTRVLATLKELAALGFRKREAAVRPYPPTSEIPVFWPIPKASAMAVVPESFLTHAAPQTTRLRDIDLKLSAALNTCGYFEKSYYAVPHGFAMATRLEQINRDGTSRPPPDRWAAEVQPLRRFSLKEYLKALFGANEGYFRIIVFVVTPEDFSQEDRTVSREEAEAWTRAGVNKLPEAIGRLEFTEDCACTALIYEFRQSDGGQEAEVSDPSELQGRTHLEKANLWRAMEN